MLNNYTIYEEFRLIERTEGHINRTWKGAHLLLFFLAFVFGSFCTFCFHMLMYLFDEKCVLFPKLLSLTSQRHNVIYEFVPTTSDLSNLPVDFVSTQWVDKSTCELPTYVPLVSGIFGLVWTTMFLMCSTGSRMLTGLQRPWRVLPPVFVFSVLMGALCIYSSIITHNGLQQLCIKLGEITGSKTCTYTVNVATLTYERRIRGVYQATRLTILTAWLHTACWLCSALLTIVRVLLVVDFQLVRVSISLRGDFDKIMEQNETQIRSVMPEYSDSKVTSAVNGDTEITEILKQSSDILFYNSRAHSRVFNNDELIEVAKSSEDDIFGESSKNTEPELTSNTTQRVESKNEKQLNITEPGFLNNAVAIARTIYEDVYDKNFKLTNAKTQTPHTDPKEETAKDILLNLSKDDMQRIYVLSKSEKSFSSASSLRLLDKRKSNLRHATTQTASESAHLSRSHKRVLITDIGNSSEEDEVDTSLDKVPDSIVNKGMQTWKEKQD